MSQRDMECACEARTAHVRFTLSRTAARVEQSRPPCARQGLSVRGRGMDCAGVTDMGQGSSARSAEQALRMQMWITGRS